MLLNKKNIYIALYSENFLCFFVCFVSSDNEGVKVCDVCAALDLKKRMGRRWFILFLFEGGSSPILLWYCGDLRDKAI